MRIKAVGGAEQEIGNVEKCLQAGFDEVVLPSLSRGTLVHEDAGLADEAEKVYRLYPAGQLDPKGFGERNRPLASPPPRRIANTYARSTIPAVAA